MSHKKDAARSSNYYNNMFIMYLFLTFLDFINELRSDKRDLLAIKVKSEICTKKEMCSPYAQLLPWQHTLYVSLDFLDLIVLHVRSNLSLL